MNKSTKLVLRSNTRAQLALELISKLETVIAYMYTLPEEILLDMTLGYLKERLYREHYDKTTEEDGFPKGWE